ncbi:rCG50908 [Rattus norvegicus]|uniref:RCG50908 n=1 Tax=Rattus norvegicus TaxID=10116 RepID=A6KJ33_RAT|nr:rCG50908 [Rattus norvegicus]
MVSTTEAAQEDAPCNTLSYHQGDLCGRHDYITNNKYLL